MLGKRSKSPPGTPRALHWAGEVQCWVLLGKEEVLPISGSGAPSLDSGCPSALWNRPMPPEGGVLERTPLSLAATPVASGSLTRTLTGAE